MDIFLGLHSIWIHFDSRSSCSSILLSSTVFLARFSLIRIPISPPLLFCQGFAIHLYPLMLIFSLFGNFVSVISAISIFAASSNDSMLLTFPLIPLTFMVAIDMDLFLRILFLFLFLLFSVSSCCLVLMLRLKFISLFFVFVLFFAGRGGIVWLCRSVLSSSRFWLPLGLRADLPLGRVLELPLGCGFQLPFGRGWVLSLGRDWELPLGSGWELPLGRGESCHLVGVRSATWQGWELLPLGRGWELPLGRDWELPLGRGQCLLIGRDCLVVLVLSVSLNSGLYVIVMDAPNDTCFAFWDLRHFILFYWRLVLDSMVQSADCSSSSSSHLLLRYLSCCSHVHRSGVVLLCLRRCSGDGVLVLCVLLRVSVGVWFLLNLLLLLSFLWLLDVWGVGLLELLLLRLWLFGLLEVVLFSWWVYMMLMVLGCRLFVCYFWMFCMGCCFFS